MNIQSFYEYNYIKSVSKILENRMPDNEIEDILLNEFLGGLFNKLTFLNARTRNKIKKMADELTKVQLEIVKVAIEADELEAEMGELENQMDDFNIDIRQPKRQQPTRSKPGRQQYSSKSSGMDSGTPLDKKKEALENKVTAIESKMDRLAGDNEKLRTFVDIQKLEAKLKANDLIIKLADEKQRDYIKKFNSKKQKQLQDMTKELIDDDLS